jgi:hypothetical protein
MAESSDVFHMLSVEDKLDGTNYPLWAYMMRHVLVAKGLWNIVQGVERRPVTHATTGTTNTCDGSTRADEDGVEDDIPQIPVCANVSVAPIAEQIRWDGRDAQAHALIPLSVKRAIIPHIRSCRTAKDAWDTLCTRLGMRFVLLTSKNSWRVST